MLTIDASKRYDIVAYDDFSKLSEEIEKVFHGRKILIVTDSTVAGLYLDRAAEKLSSFQVYRHVFPAGERSKTVDTYLGIIKDLAENNFSRSDAVLALGGGVVGDVAGFAAATYMRGIGFIQCPTTFLSMIDSSVGGKTAVDLPEGKNLLGAFYQPDLVYIALSTLRTLPEREVRCGMGEAVKYAFLSKTVDKKLLLGGMTEELIFRCLKIKADVVASDEFDHGVRAYLNLGHTLGHAIEKLSDFSLSHGECVLKGLAQIIKMSAKYYGLSQEKRAEMDDLVACGKVSLDPVYPIGDVLRETVHDKKKEAQGVKFVLLRDVGRPESVLLTTKEAEELLR